MMPNNPHTLSFHPLQSDPDYATIHAIYLESTQADGIEDPATLEDIRRWCGPSKRFDPHTDLLIAQVEAPGGEPIPVGFSRLGWYTGLGGCHLYTQSSYLRPAWRVADNWPRIIWRNEIRLREIAQHHVVGESGEILTEQYFQAWTTRTQTEWIAALEILGYQAVRHFHNMLCPLEGLPEPELPPGFEVRPAQPEHYRPIWEAQREVQLELFEVFAENWSDDRYPAWRDDRSHTPQHWQVAWDRDQVAGMVLGRIDAEANAALQRKRGTTEHVFVRKPWRKRGLAKALVLRNLHDLHAHGMTESELGVDAENDSRAYRLYEQLGFKTFSVDIWYRKEMD